MGYRIRYGVHRTKFCWLLPELLLLWQGCILITILLPPITVIRRRLLTVRKWAILFVILRNMDKNMAREIFSL